MNYSNLLFRVISSAKMKALDQALQTQYMPLEELQELRNTKFLKISTHIKENVPYYKEVLNDVDLNSIEDITKIPFLTKDIIRANQDRLKTLNAPSDSFITNATSGSTGENLSFYTDKADHYSGACQLRGDMMNGFVFGEKQVRLWGATRDLDRGLKGRLLGKYLRRRITLSSFNMTDTDMSRYVEIINKFKPRLLIGYPTGLHLFSEFIQNEKLKIHSPKTIISGGETLYDFQRESIQETFKTRLLNRYGCREVNHIAGECEVQHGLHISSDHIIVEILDENGNPCEPGKLGEIVVTDLDNYAFPLIRYKIGDLGVASNRQCSCGRTLPMLERVEGRTFDIITGVNNNHVTGTFWTLLKYQFKGMDKIQVIQNKRDEVDIKLMVNEAYDKGEYDKLISTVKEQLGEEMIVNVEVVDDIPLTKTGKFRWVISNVSPYVKNSKVE